MNILSVHDLKKFFGGVHALDGVTFKVIPNKVNLLIGANGSGKTTLINAISGIVHADCGNVLLGRINITKKRPDQIFQQGIIRTFQNPRLFRNLSVLENLLIVHSGAGDAFRHALLPNIWKRQELHAKKQAQDILESLDLAENKDKLAYDLSGGQIKLLELGKTLMCDAAVVLLDEPIASINPVLAHKIFSKISSICKSKKTTFLIIEHRLDIALQYADYVFVMDKGKIIAHDEPQHILENTLVQESYLGQ